MAAPVAQHPLEQYEALDIIGNGSFGIIRKVRRKSDGIILARKELNFERMTERDRKQIVAEVNILKDLCHENIVRYHDRYVDRDNGILYILMEYCGGGDLGTIIKNCTRANRLLPEDTIWSYFLQILLALQHCHSPASEATGASAGTTSRQQILHRDLKPENVFLDANQVVKLGDFGLSKALGSATFANTYVGTPYYMSPELMQEKSYDSKSDIWSLGCLIYELCALKPPFHEAKTHNELSIFIRNGRIPPLPRGYSQGLHQIIKAMLNINPAMRPSAQQLLQNERLGLVSKVHETQKMLSMAKAHKQALVVRERDLLLRERELLAHEASIEQRITEAVAKREAELEAYAAQVITERVSEAVATREAELRDAIMNKEREVRERLDKREAELLQAVVRREEELRVLWEQYEVSLREDLRKREEEVARAQKAIQEGERQPVMQMPGEPSSVYASDSASPDTQPPDATPPRAVKTTAERPCDTPLTKFASPSSAMRGVILTDTGEALATPHPVELARIVLDSPCVGLNFGGIFDAPGLRRRNHEDESEDSSSSDGEKETVSPPLSSSAPPTRLRKPSIHSSSLQREARPPSTSLPTPLPTTTNLPTQAPLLPRAISAPLYNLDDDENLPSPFLKRADRNKPSRRGTTNDLRAKAVANAALSVMRAGRRSPSVSRPSLERAKQASEDAKKALFRP